MKLVNLVKGYLRETRGSALNVTVKDAKLLHDFATWADKQAAQHRVQLDVCPKCGGRKYLGSQWMPRPCDACNSTGKRR